MRTFSRTNQFKKDVKRCLKRGFNGAKLKAAMDLIIDEVQLSERMKDHPLRGRLGRQS